MILVALWLLMIANYLDRVAISFAGPAIMASLSMGAKDFGVVLSSFGVGFLMAQIPGGLLSDRFGARPMLVIASLLWALFTGLKIGRASCRERGCQYVSISVVAVPLKKKKHK